MGARVKAAMIVPAHSECSINSCFDQGRICGSWLENTELNFWVEVRVSFQSGQFGDPADFNQNYPGLPRPFFYGVFLGSCLWPLVEAPSRVVWGRAPAPRAARAETIAQQRVPEAYLAPPGR